MKKQLALLALLLVFVGQLCLAQTKPHWGQISNKPMLNVKEFDVKGDGTDETTEIQNAIDNLSTANGGTLFFPQGNFRARELRMKSNVNLVGVGSSTIKLHDPGTAGLIIRAQGQTNILVYGLEFDCTIDATTTADVGCVEIASSATAVSENIWFENCVFRNAQNQGWLHFRKGTKNSGVDQCLFLDHLYEVSGGVHGLSISEDCKTIKILNSTFDRPSSTTTSDESDAHLGIDRAFDVLVQGCSFLNSKTNGLTIEDNAETLWMKVAVIDCYFENSANKGVVMTNGKIDGIISGCTFKNNQVMGLQISGGNRQMVVTDCLFDDNATSTSLANGQSQLYIGVGSEAYVSVDNCQFRTTSTDSEYIHLYYLSGEVNFNNLTFVGGTGGYGIYSTNADDKSQERNSSIIKNLRFNGPATHTYYVPQFFGDTWTEAGTTSATRLLQTTIHKNITASQADLIFQIGTLDHSDTNAGGQMYVTIDLVVGVDTTNVTTAVGAGGTYRVAFSRSFDGTLGGSSIQEDAELIAVEDAAARNIDSMALTTADNVGLSNEPRIDFFLNVQTSGTATPTSLTVDAHVKVLYNGFRTPPVIY